MVVLRLFFLAAKKVDKRGNRRNGEKNMVGMSLSLSEYINGVSIGREKVLPCILVAVLSILQSGRICSSANAID